LLALAALLAPQRARASAFLGRSAADGGSEELERRQQGILDALEAALGSGQRRVTEARLGRLEEALRPIFAVLPKNASGKVGAPAARYALHRLFVQLHGWQVQGLEPAGERWAGASPAEALGGRVPGQVRDLFEQRLGGRGLDLHELGVLAASLEHRIHGEALGRLRLAYAATGRQPEGAALPGPEATEVMHAYLAAYLVGANASSLPPQRLARVLGKMKQFYPNWPEALRFLEAVRQEVAPGPGPFPFERVSAVVEEAGERFGRWQDLECRELKAELLALEEAPGSGRVRLADFYRSALHEGKWQFSEGPEYLRQLGALDDSEPEVLRVIIPNYVNGPSNCIAASSYYGICCIDECEALLGQLERALGAPTAGPEELAQLVAALPSASLPANRTLAPGLLRRLGEVAEHHGGRVPLHGRLFLQWLHLAYPRECPYPHVSGTTRPLGEGQYAKAAGRRAKATEEEMQQHIEAAHGARAAALDDEGLCSSMWSMEEELVDPRAHQLELARASAAASEVRAGAGRRAAARLLAMLAAAGSLAAALARLLRPALAASGPSKHSAPPTRYAV